MYGIGYLVGSAASPAARTGCTGRAHLTCDCLRSASGGPLQARLGDFLFTAAERLDAEQGDPTLGPIPYQLTSKALAALTVRKPGDAA